MTCLNHLSIHHTVVKFHNLPKGCHFAILEVSCWTTFVRWVPYSLSSFMKEGGLPYLSEGLLLQAEVIEAFPQILTCHLSPQMIGLIFHQTWIQVILERNGKDSLHPKPYPKKYFKLSSLVCWRRPGILKVRTKLPQFGGLEIHHPDVHLHLSNIELRSGFESEKNLGFFGYNPPKKKNLKTIQKKYLASIHV